MEDKSDSGNRNVLRGVMIPDEARVKIQNLCNKLDTFAWGNGHIHEVRMSISQEFFDYMRSLMEEDSDKSELSFMFAQYRFYFKVSPTTT